MEIMMIIKLQLNDINFRDTSYNITMHAIVYV